MTAAPTANQILRSLDRHRAQAQFASLADLDAAHSDAVRRALSAVRPTSRIDVPKLLDSVRRDLAERAERDAQSEPDAAGILRYRLMLMSEGELTGLRDDLRTRVAAGEGDQPFEPGSAGALILSRIDGIATRLRAHDDVEPDVEPDPEPRRSIPRRRPARTTQEATAPAEARAPVEREARSSGPRKRSARPFLGPRLLGPGDPDRPYGMSVDYDPRASSRLAESEGFPREPICDSQ